jgi:hypothetical protein
MAQMRGTISAGAGEIDGGTGALGSFGWLEVTGLIAVGGENGFVLYF